MRLLKPEELDRTRRVRIFRQSPAGNGFVAAISTGMLVLPACYLFSEHLIAPSLFMFALNAVLLIVFARPFLGTLKKMSWVMRVGEGYLWLNLQSYLNPVFNSSIPTIVEIPIDEIMQVFRDVGTDRGRRQERLFLKLRGPMPQELRETLRSLEREQRRSRRGAHHHFPVMLDDKHDALLVIWRSYQDLLTPGMNLAMSLLKERVTVSPPRESNGARHMRRVSARFGWGLLIVGVGLSGVFTETVFEGIRSLRWPSVEGRIRSVYTVTSSEYRPRHTPFHAARAVYDYKVRGVSFSGRRIYSEDMFVHSSYGAKSLASRFQEGESARVYFDPRIPARSVLINGPSPFSSMAFVMGLMLAACGCWLLRL